MLFRSPNARSCQGGRSQVAPTPPAPSSRSSISSMGINPLKIDPQVSNNIQDNLGRAIDDAQPTQPPISQLKPQLECEVKSFVPGYCRSAYTESQTRAQTPYTDSVLKTIIATLFHPIYIPKQRRHQQRVIGADLPCVGSTCQVHRISYTN